MAEDYRTIPTHVTAVVGASYISPLVRRITLGGGLERLESAGPDSFLYLLAPPPGRDELTVDTDFSWEQYQKMADSDRPVGAYYTLRHHRRALGEIDLDMVLHGDEGEGSRWARAAESGDPVALWGPRTTFHPPPGTTDYLLVADDTGLPAASAIVEWLPEGCRAHVIVEVADAAEKQPLCSPAELAVDWLYRDGAAPGLTTALYDAVESVDDLPPSVYVWGGGESRSMTAIRKLLRSERDLPREHVSLTPYWRHPTSPPDEPE